MFEIDTERLRRALFAGYGEPVQLTALDDNRSKH